jgi:hypothetical protein
MPQPTPEFSASVALRFEVEGRVLSVSQVGDRSLLLRLPVEVAPDSEGRVIVTVDGEDRAYPVVVNSVAGREVRFEPVDPVEAAGVPF